MTHIGQEVGFGGVRQLRLFLRAHQTSFQCALLRDVQEGHDETAGRQPDAAHHEDRAFGPLVLVRGGSGAEPVQPLPHLHLNILLRAIFAALGQITQDILRPGADTAQRLGQFHHLLERAVAEPQARLDIEHRQPLRQVQQHGFQQFALFIDLTPDRHLAGDVASGAAIAPEPSLAVEHRHAADAQANASFPVRPGVRHLEYVFEITVRTAVLDGRHIVLPELCVLRAHAAHFPARPSDEAGERQAGHRQQPFRAIDETVLTVGLPDPVGGHVGNVAEPGFALQPLGLQTRKTPLQPLAIDQRHQDQQPAQPDQPQDEPVPDRPAQRVHLFGEAVLHLGHPRIEAQQPRREDGVALAVPWPLSDRLTHVGGHLLDLQQQAIRLAPALYAGAQKCCVAEHMEDPGHTRHVTGMVQAGNEIRVAGPYRLLRIVEGKPPRAVGQRHRDGPAIGREIRLVPAVAIPQERQHRALLITGIIIGASSVGARDIDKPDASQAEGNGGQQRDDEYARQSRHRDRGDGAVLSAGHIRSFLPVQQRLSP